MNGNKEENIFAFSILFHLFGLIVLTIKIIGGLASKTTLNEYVLFIVFLLTLLIVDNILVIKYESKKFIGLVIIVSLYWSFMEILNLL